MPTLLERWMSASHQFTGLDQQLDLVMMIQRLGRLDVQIREEETRFFGLTEEQRNHQSELMTMDNLTTQSWLWVLGAYELIRTLDQILRVVDANRLSAKEVNKVKDEIGEIRMPLAKLERQKKPKVYAFAVPGWSAIEGIAWTLDGFSFTSRRQLGERLLYALELRKAESDQY